MNRLGTALWGAALAATVAIGGGARAADFEMKLGHANDANAETSLFHAFALEFKKLTVQNAGRRVQVTIFPAFQLGSEEEMVRGTQIGTQEATLASFSNISVFAKSLAFFVMPYVFESDDEARYVIDRNFDQMNKWAVDEAGLRILTVLDAGFRNLTNSKRDVKSLADLQGLKIRVPGNPIMVATFKSFGIDPVPMAWGEVFNALQQKVIDGQENPYDVLLSVKFHEVQKYVTDSQHFLQAAGLVVSERWFKTLPADLQQAVVQAGRDSMWWYRGYYQPDLRNKVELLKTKYGMVFDGKPTDYAEWAKRGRAIWPEQYKFIGNGDAERGKKVMDTILASAQEYRSKLAK